MKKNKGFTLIELMVALAVFAIMVAVAAPNLQGFTMRNRLASQTNFLVAHLNLARSEAVKRNRPVSICISNSAHTACTTTGQWEDGWIVFVDVDGEGDLETGEGDIILNVNDELGGGSTIRSGQYTNSITYERDGSANLGTPDGSDTGGNTSTTGSFVVCNHEAALNMARSINISVAGHISMGNDPDSDGIPNNFTNTELSSCTTL